MVELVANEYQQVCHMCGKFEVMVSPTQHFIPNGLRLDVIILHDHPAVEIDR